MLLYMLRDFQVKICEFPFCVCEPKIGLKIYVLGTFSFLLKKNILKYSVIVQHLPSTKKVVLFTFR